MYFGILKEGLSDILYHKTGGIEDVVSILQSDTFDLKPTAGTRSDAQLNRGKEYYMSTARSKTGAYTRSSDDFTAILVLDGKKLQQRFKGFAVDYWNMNMADTGAKRNDYSQILQSKELEDRIVSDKPEIKGFSKYIKEIHVSIPSKNELNLSPYKERLFLANMSKEERRKALGAKSFNADSSSWSQYQNNALKKLCLIALKKNIPVYFWPSDNDFTNSNPKTRKTIKDILPLLKNKSDKRESPFDPDYDFSEGAWLRKSSYNNSKRDFEKWMPYIELIQKNPGDKITALTKEWLREFLYIYQYAKEDRERSLKADIHNASNIYPDARFFKRFIKLMQTSGNKTPESLLNYLYKKWNTKLIT